MTTASVDQLLAAARRHIDRVSPEDLGRWRVAGALVIDIRPERQRADEGEFDHAIVVERNVLEWRLDPTSDARIPEAVDHDVEVVVICSEGYSSSLAAASLQALGLHCATDLVGGVRAWKEAGLPVTPPASGAPDPGDRRAGPSGS